jgi:hypothetical protein
MASLSSVTIDLQVKGEATATKSLERFYNAGEKVGTSVVGLANKISSTAGEWSKLDQLYKQNLITKNAMLTAQSKLAAQLSSLTGLTEKDAKAALKSAQAKKEQAKAADEAAKAAQKQAADAARLAREEKQRQDAWFAQQRRRLDMIEQSRRMEEQAAAKQAALDAAEAQNKQRLADQYRQLQGAMNPTIAMQNRMRDAAKSLRQAVDAGVISTQEAAKTLREYRNALREGQIAGNQTASGMNRLGVVTQQAGYQVGDFVVQIQSGTNAFVAFGQQATQLIGTFAMMARTTRSIAIFSALGVIVPIATAIGAAMSRASGEGRTLEDVLGDLDSATNDLRSTFKMLEDDKLEETFGDVSDAVRSIQSAMIDLDRAAQLKGLEGLVEQLKDASEPSWWRVFDTQVAQAIENYRVFTGLISAAPDNPKFDMGSAEATQEVYDKAFKELGIQMGQAQFDAYVGSLRELAASGDVKGVINEFGNFFSEIGSGEGMSIATIEMFKQMRDSLISAAEAVAEMNGSAKAAEEANENIKNAAEDQAEAFAASAERMRDIREEQEKAAAKDAETFANMQQTLGLEERKLSVLQSYNSEGEKTNRTLMEEAELAGEVVRAKLESQYSSEALTKEQQAIVDAIVQTVVEQELANQAIQAGKEEAQGLEAALNAAAAAMGRLEGVGDSIAKALAVAKAEAVALANATNVTVAGQIAGRRFDVNKAYEEAIAAGVDRDLAMGERASAEADLNELETTLKENAKTLEAQREADRAANRGGTAARKNEEYLYKLEQEAIAKRALIGLSEEQKLQDERRAQITLKLAEDGRELTEREKERIEGIIKTEAETRKLMQAEQERQQLMDTVEGHIKSAFMSMVDGSASVEDAFRNMLRNIILAIYEQQVAEPAARGIGNFLSSIISGIGGGAPTAQAPTTSIRPVARPLAADGRAYNNGVEFFANGGIVSSPTLFGHSTGVGMMGEAGPEAIMPLKRGANGKLGVQVDGNAGNVTVNQYFNIAANGDDSVRRIVRQETPRIAEQAKAAVLDAKRRGGSYGRSF